MEGYITEECLTFCSRYLQGVDTVFNRPQRHSDFVANAELYKFLTAGRLMGKGESIVLDHKSIAQAHRYVLLHSEIISNYRRLAYLMYFNGFKYHILFFKLF